MSAAHPAPRAALRDWTLLLLCNLIWASQFVLVKLVENELGPLFTTAVPMLLATLFLAPVVWVERRSRDANVRAPVRGVDVGGFAIIGLLGQVIAQLFATWGTQRSLASNAAILTLALPVATAFIAHFVLRERMSPVRWASFVLALAGVLVSSGRDLREMDLAGRGYLVGNAMVFLSILGSAFYNVYSKRLLERFTPLEVLLGSYVFACALLVPVALIGEPDGFSRLAALTVRGWTGLGLLAVFQYFVSMVIFLTVLTRLDATQAAVSNYLIPFFGVLLAWALLDEKLLPVTLAGGALVLVSTLLVTVWEEKFGRRSPSP